MSKEVNQSIDRTLQVLELFSIEKPEWGVTEISTALNFYKSTVHNILSTLETRGFVQKDPVSEKYRLGVKFFELGSVVLNEMDMKRVAHPYMEMLSKEFNETVHLGIYIEGEVLSIERAESNRTLRPQIYVGKRAPLYCTAVGKAIMAFLPEEEIDTICSKGLKAFTPRTITNLPDMKRELARIRQQGYAIDNMEHEEGVSCVAGPIRDCSGSVIGSMSVSGPSYRVNEERIPVIAERVCEYCAKISAEMGCHGEVIELADESTA